MCPNDSELIRLAAGELPEQQRAVVLAHLAECSACRQRQQSFAATWDLLGEWQVPAPARDIAPAVLARARRASVARTVAAVAASIVLAAGMGSGIALLAVPGTARVAQSRPVVSEYQVAQSIGLDAFGGEPIGLAAVFTPEEPKP